MAVVCAMALQSSRIEVAEARVADNAILDAVEGVTGSDCRLVDELQLVHRENACSVLMARFIGPEKARIEVRPVVAGVARNDAVVIGGEALSFIQPLFASGRATPKVCVAR